jgi:hypothetical protein
LTLGKICRSGDRGGDVAGDLSGRVFSECGFCKWRPVEILLSKFTALPDPGLFGIRSHASRVAPGVNTKKGRSQRGGEVHGTAVDADDELSTTKQSDQLQKVRFSGQVANAVWEAVRDLAAANDQNVEVALLTKCDEKGADLRRIQ